MMQQGQFLTLTANDPTKGDGVSEVIIENEGECAPLALSGKYLLMMCDACKTDTLIVGLNAPTEAIRFWDSTETWKGFIGPMAAGK